MIIFGIFTGLKITTNIVPLFKKAIAWKISEKKNHKQAVQARNQSAVKMDNIISRFPGKVLMLGFGEEKMQGPIVIILFNFFLPTQHPLVAGAKGWPRKSTRQCAIDILNRINR